jgi:signal peptide peptidase SppA
MQNLLSEPLFLGRGTEAIFESCINHLLKSEHAEKMLDPTASNDNDGFWPDANDSGDWRNYLRPYNVVNGILHIPVMGILLNKFPYQYGRWATGYEYLTRALARGVEDEGVKAILFIVDSPGGIVAGNFELVDKIFSARGDKPIRAIAADRAYSAAYAIASAADEVIVTRSSGVGSIGVVAVHVEFSAQLKARGIAYTYMFEGKFKKDGNPHEPLSKQAREGIERRVTKLYQVFTSTVARNRGMKKKEIRGTEAQTYDAEEGIEIGLSDRIGTLEDEVIIFAKQIAQTEEDQMAKDNETIDKADHDKAVTTATAQGKTDGATAERTRINDITGSDAAKTRPKAAHSVAMTTDMSVDAAATFLATLPEETPETPAAPKGKGKDDTNAEGTNHFDAAMGKNNPDVGAGDSPGDDEGEEMSASDQILADSRAATGLKAKK